MEVDSAPYRGELFFAIIHDNPGLVGTPIYDHDGKDKTPFEVWTTNESKSERAKIEKIGEVYGAVVSVNNSRLVNFKFPVLSSDFRSKFIFCSFLGIFFDSTTF